MAKTLFKIAFISNETTIINSFCTLLQKTEGVSIVGVFGSLSEIKDKNIHADIILSHFNPKTDFTTSFLIEKNEKASLKRLTPRENEIMGLLSEGLLYKEIARRLNITLGTLKQYAHIIYEKLGASNRTEAINTYFNLIKKIQDSNKS